jgi:hypothetical protein
MIMLRGVYYKFEAKKQHEDLQVWRSLSEEC